MSLIALLSIPLGLTDWTDWSLLLLAIFATPYLSSLLIVRFSLVKANFTIERFDPLESLPPDRANEFFGKAAEQLQRCGFEAVDHLYVSDLREGTLITFSVFVNREADDAAMAVDIWVKNNPAVVDWATTSAILKIINKNALRQQHIEFSSELVNGTEIKTNNSREEGALVGFPWKRVVQLDTERDVAALYHLHQCAVGKWATATKRSLNDVEDWAEEIRANTVREYEGFVDAGYYVLDASGEYYRPTWKGAFLMSWQQLWPIGMFRRIACRRRAEALRSQAPSYAA